MEIRDKLGKLKSWEEAYEVAEEMKKRREKMPIKDKFGYYIRY